MEPTTNTEPGFYARLHAIYERQQTPAAQIAAILHRQIIEAAPVADPVADAEPDADGE